MEEEVIKFDDRIVKAQIAVAKGNWKGFEEILVKEENKDLLFEVFDFGGNTPIYTAALAGKTEILRKLLLMLNQTEQHEFFFNEDKRNYEKNTLLHEVAVFCNKDELIQILEVIKDFVEVKDLLRITNDRDETPVSRAAKVGNLAMLKYLHTNYRLDTGHFPLWRGDKKLPVLIACILNFCFEVAVWLVEVVAPDLAQEKKKNDDKEEDDTEITSLQMLSRMQMAFKSTEIKKMGITRKLIYYS